MSTAHGIEVRDLPDGFVALEVVYSVKVLNEDGEVNLINGASDGLTTWEALGMLISAADDVRAALQSHEGDE